MLVGTLLGLIIAALLLVAFWLTAQNRLLKGANKEQATELYAAQLRLGQIAHLEQERQKVKESITFNFTEEQITTLAHKVSSRVQTILDSQQQAALDKLN